MKRALFAGTFDPPTLGHLDVIQRAALLCDELWIGIASNPQKEKYLFSLEERKEMLKTITSSIPNIKIVHFAELVIEYAKKQGMSFLIRGLRTFSDYEYEFSMALINRKLSGIDTAFLMADPHHAHIRSSFLRELGAHGTHLQDFVPASIEKKVFARLKE